MPPSPPRSAGVAIFLGTLFCHGVLGPVSPWTRFPSQGPGAGRAEGQARDALGSGRPSLTRPFPTPAGRPLPTGGAVRPHRESPPSPSAPGCQAAAAAEEGRGPAPLSPLWPPEPVPKCRLSPGAPALVPPHWWRVICPPLHRPWELRRGTGAPPGTGPRRRHAPPRQTGGGRELRKSGPLLSPRHS